MSQQHPLHARPTVIVVGAGYAGLTAIHRLRDRAHVTLVTPDDYFVDRIRLHQFATGESTERDVALQLDELLPADVTRIQGSVASVRPGHVRLHDGRELSADHIVVAAGSGVGEGVTNLESSRAVRAQLADLKPGSRVEIRGAGHTGVELASELAEQRPDLQIVLVDPAGILPRVGPRARKLVQRYLQRQGVTIATAPPRADLIVDCTGFSTPKIEGLRRPDDTLAFGEGLWVAGDIAMTGHRWSCAAAEPMGAHVADNIARCAAGLAPQPFRFGFAIQCISLGRTSGVIQTVRADDAPRALVLRGRAGALVKELISRMARRIAAGSASRYRWPAGPVISSWQHKDLRSGA